MIYRYLKSVNHPLSWSFRDGVCPFGLRQAFARWFLAFAGATQFKPE